MRFILPNPDWYISTDPRWAEHRNSVGHICYIRHRHKLSDKLGERYSELTWSCQYKDGIPYNCNGCGITVPEEVVGFRNLTQLSLEGVPHEEDRYTRP